MNTGKTPTLREEIMNYIQELEDLLENDEGIEGDAVPGELRSILIQTKGAD